MPKFVEILDSDDEIEILPTPVKPPPTVIDLLNSSSEEDKDKQDAEREDKQKADRKKKKRRKRASNEASRNGLTNPIDSFFAPSGSNVSRSTNSTNVDENLVNSFLSCGKEIVGGVRNDNRPRESNADRLLHSQVNLSSNNALFSKSSSTLSNNKDNPVSTDESLPSIRIASSIFESVETAVVDLVGDQNIENVPGQSVSNPENPIAAGSRKKKQSGSKATPSPRPSDANGGEIPPKVVRRRHKISQSVTGARRTNEEISNFLTTLGIPTEPSELEERPVRVRKPRKKRENNITAPLKTSSTCAIEETINQVVLSLREESAAVDFVKELVAESSKGEQIVLDAEPVSVRSSTSPSSLLPDPQPSTSQVIASDNVISADAEEPESVSVTNESFVEVVEEIGLERAKKSKRKSISKATPVVNDIEDEDITDKELQEVVLNIKTNIVFPTTPGESSSRSVELVTEDDGTVPSTSTSSEHRDRVKPRPRYHDRSDEKVDNEFTNKINEIYDQILENTKVKSAFNLNESASTSTSAAWAVPAHVELDRIDRSRRSASRNKNDTGNEAGDVVDPLSSAILPTGQDQASSENPGTRAQPHLPSGWTPEMIDFYDTVRDADRNLDEVLNTMSRNPSLWRMSWFAKPRPNQNRRVRCVKCNQLGHFARDCKDKRKDLVCTNCGETGHLADSRSRKPCPKMMCLNCGRPGTRFSTACSSCTYSRRLPECKVCQVYGHEESVCPDNWRRYHSTTTVSVVDGKEVALESTKPLYRKNEEMYCCNCAGKHSYYHCRIQRMSQYHRNKPFVVNNLPSLDTNQMSISSATSASAPVSTITTSRTSLTRQVVLERADSKEEEEDISIIRVKIVNDGALAQPTTVSKDKQPHWIDMDGRGPQNDNWKCINYPDCKNKPSLGNSCHNMFLVQSEHLLLLAAQKNGELKSIKRRNDVALTVLKDRGNVHIWGSKHTSAKEDLLKLLDNLKKPEEKRKSPSPQKKKANSSVSTEVVDESPVTSPGIDEVLTEFIVDHPRRNSSCIHNREESSVELSSLLINVNSKPDADHSVENTESEFLKQNIDKKSLAFLEGEKSSEPVSNKSDNEESKQNKEIVTATVVDAPEVQPEGQNDLDTPLPSPELIILDESEDEELAALNSKDQLRVVLLSSEWDLIFPESLNNDGLLYRLSKQFGVDISINKLNLTATIEKGRPINRKLAQQNIVFWLECKAANAEFTVLVTLEDRETLSSQHQMQVAGTTKRKRQTFQENQNSSNNNPNRQRRFDSVTNEVEGRNNFEMSNRGFPRNNIPVQSSRQQNPPRNQQDEGRKRTRFTDFYTPSAQIPPSNYAQLAGPPEVSFQNQYNPFDHPDLNIWNDQHVGYGPYNARGGGYCYISDNNVNYRTDTWVNGNGGRPDWRNRRNNNNNGRNYDDSNQERGNRLNFYNYTS